MSGHPVSGETGNMPNPTAPSEYLGDISWRGTRLKKVAEKIKNKIDIRDIKIYLGKMLVNKNSVILSGFPDKTFWELQKILDQENNQYLRLRLAWGAHITAGRFNKNESDLADQFCGRGA